jgi:5-methyltetrahydropteroyltriglutamate--homocysteine methyltransferase
MMFRADHIGSLLRLKKLREAFRLHAAGEMSAEKLTAAQDEAIRNVVRMQEDLGLQVVTDGEFRRASYWERFVRRTKGLEVRDAVFSFHDADGRQSNFTAPYVSGKVARAAPITADEFGFLWKLTRRTPKITMPAPSTMHFYRFTDWGSAYQDPEAFFSISARCIRPKSPISRPLAAATCSSTR